MEDQAYMERLDADLKAAHKRVQDGMAASNFLNTSEGKLIQDWLNQRIGLLIESMSGKAPLSDRDYLAAHGAIRELKDFNLMLQSKALDGKAAAEDVKVINGQQKELKYRGY